MKNNPINIFVVGGGTGGTLAANLLAKHLRSDIRAGRAQVHLISGSDTRHIFQPGYLHIAFGNLDPHEIMREENELVNHEVHLIQQDAARFDLDRKEIVLMSGEKITYDYLIIATGSVADPTIIPGLGEAALNFHTSPEESKKIWNALERFDGGHVVIGVAGVPHKCPPSPNEGAFLLDDYLRKRGVRDKAKITFVTPYPRSYPAEPMSKVVTPLFEKRGIELVTFFNVESVDPVKHEMYSLEGEAISYDLLIMVPPHRGANVVKNSGIGDTDGWIPTDKHTMRISGHDMEYAIGDATNIPVSKTGVTAHLEAIVAVKNILTSLTNQNVQYEYTGRINCPFEMGSGKASFVVGSYEMPVREIQPNKLRYFMKRTFANFYWRTLSGTWDWLLGVYFGETCKKVTTEIGTSEVS